MNSSPHMNLSYEAATIRRLPKRIGLFCKRILLKRLYSARETYAFKEPTHHSHPLGVMWWFHVWEKDGAACVGHDLFVSGT